MRVILASKSPRRIELLKILLDRFEVVPSDVKESEVYEKEPVKFAKRVALLKAERVSKGLKGGIVIGADTIVVLNGEILEKPKNREEAISMLFKLSKREHKVITAIAIVNTERNEVYIDYEKTLVKMRRIDRGEVDSYIKSDEWRDKAGGYGIQGQAGGFVEYIKGDYFNVVGLPLRRLRRLLYNAGYYRN